MRLLNILKSKKGSSLVVVIITFAVLIILGTSLITIASYSHKNSTYYHREQQAQYTAASAINSITKGLSDPNVSVKLIDKVLASGSTGVLGKGDLTAQNMGTYDVKMTMTSSTPPLMRAEITSNYQGSVYNLSAYYKEGKGDRMNPLDFIFFSKFGNINGIMDSDNPPNITTIDGKVYSTGNSTFKNAKFKQKMFTFGTVTFNNVSFESDLIIKGDFLPTYPNATYGGKVFQQNGTNPLSGAVPITFTGFTDRIQYDQRRWSAINYFARMPGTDVLIEFNKGMYTGYTDGIIFDAGTYIATLPDGTAIDVHNGSPDTTFDEGPPDQIITYTSIDNKFTLGNGDEIDMSTKLYTAADGETLDFSNIPWIVNGIVMPTPPPITGFSEIALTGRITSDATDGTKSYRAFGNSTTGNVILDTDDGDIHIYLQNNFTIRDKISIEGDNNVYIHLNGKNLTIDDVYVGDNQNMQHQLFIEGTGSNLLLNGDATLKGAAYLYPNGSSGGTYTDNTVSSGNKVYGSITATPINITSGNTYTYCDYFKKPVFDGTIRNPQEVDGSTSEDEQPVYCYPKNNTNQNDWVLVKYDK